MAKLFIPACGNRITLSKPWTFILYLESRNIKFGQSVGVVGKDVKWSQWEDMEDSRGRLKKTEVTLPAGTELEFDRVYDDYDSITFKVVKDGKAKSKQRFWVKLFDTASIEYELASDSLYRDRIKAVRRVMEA